MLEVPFNVAGLPIRRGVQGKGYVGDVLCWLERPVFRCVDVIPAAKANLAVESHR